MVFIVENDRVIIFDTTLRDGEQSPGASMTMEEKVEVAKKLDELGVDVIEAGFPVSNQKDFEAFKVISREVKNAQVCALARCVEKDITIAWEAIKEAKNPRIHVFLATSDIHLKHKLEITRQEALMRIKEMVSYAKSLCKNIEFSAEDASRTENEFLKEAFRTAIKAGATTLNIPDTVGYSQPEEFGRIVKSITQMQEVIEGNIIVSVHCHDDLGLATANSLEGIKNGARQAECTINGIGERAGNAALEEIVVALKTREDYYKLETKIKTEKIMEMSKIVSEKTRMSVQKNKAIVGENAFAHESGVHQHGVIKKAECYEVINAKSVGAESKLTLGKLSGRHAVNLFLKSRGINASEEILNKAIEEIKKSSKEEDMEMVVLRAAEQEMLRIKQ